MMMDAQRLAEINNEVMARRVGMDAANDLCRPQRAGSVAGWIERGEEPPVRAANECGQGRTRGGRSFSMAGVRPAPALAHSPARAAGGARRLGARVDWRGRCAVALQALRVLLMSLGAVSAIAYLMAMPLWLRIAGGVAGAVSWFALYKLIEAWRLRA